MNAYIKYKYQLKKNGNACWKRENKTQAKVKLNADKISAKVWYDE